MAGIEGGALVFSSSDLLDPDPLDRCGAARDFFWACIFAFFLSGNDGLRATANLACFSMDGVDGLENFVGGF
jgi:hypothetical protein